MPSHVFALLTFSSSCASTEAADRPEDADWPAGTAEDWAEESSSILSDPLSSLQKSSSDVEA